MYPLPRATLLVSRPSRATPKGSTLARDGCPMPRATDPGSPWDPPVVGTGQPMSSAIGTEGLWSAAGAQGLRGLGHQSRSLAEVESRHRNLAVLVNQRQSLAAAGSQHRNLAEVASQHNNPVESASRRRSLVEAEGHRAAARTAAEGAEMEVTPSRSASLQVTPWLLGRTIASVSMRKPWTRPCGRRRRHLCRHRHHGLPPSITDPSWSPLSSPRIFYRGRLARTQGNLMADHRHPNRSATALSGQSAWPRVFLRAVSQLQQEAFGRRHTRHQDVRKGPAHLHLRDLWRMARS